MIHLPEDLKPLTSLRFFAAIWVAFFAFWPHMDAALTPMVVAKGYLGVDLFFVLSGFILCHVYLERFGTRGFDYRAFLTARVARIYPLHLATLLGVMALGLGATAAGISIDNNILGWDTLIPNLLLVQSWGFVNEAGWNHPSWSVSAEWSAYLTFPLYAYVAWRLRTRPLLALLLAAALLIGLYEVFPRLAGFPLTQATIHWGALRIVPAFAYGCALYLAFRQQRLTHPVLATIASTGFVITSASIGSDVLTVLSAGSLIVALGSLQPRQLPLLSSAPAVWLGEISYAIYMVCAPWLMVSTNLAAKLFDAPEKTFSPLIWMCFIAGLIPTAALAHHLIEQPARRFIRNIGPRQPREEVAQNRPPVESIDTV